jgi:hypothetical protein
MTVIKKFCLALNWRAASNENGTMEVKLYIHQHDTLCMKNHNQQLQISVTI